MKPQQRSARRGAAPAVPAPLSDHLPVLLWDVSPDTIDPQGMARTIVQRVIERGTPGDWEAMLAYYGRERVQQIARAAPYLSDAAIQLVSAELNLEKESLRCYQRKRSVPQTFNC